MCYRTFPAWHQLEGKAVPDQAWERFVEDIRGIALGCFARYTEEGVEHARAREAQRTLLRQ
eukprot:8701733-Pyramimonas_sp.AAC.1